MAAKILITGATGTVGFEVVRQLVASNYGNVCATWRTPSNKVFIEGVGIPIYELDYFKPDLMERAFSGTESLFLLTPVTDECVKMTEMAVEAAKMAGVRHIVKQSEWDCDAPDAPAYFRWHLDAEEVVKESGIPCTFLRPTNFMQNFMKFYGTPQSIKENDCFRISFGENPTSFVDAQDIASVAVESLLNPEAHASKTYALTGECLSGVQIAKIFSNELGRPIRYEKLSSEEESKMLAAINAPDWLRETFLVVNEINNSGKWAFDSGDVEKVTGKKPRTFQDFVRHNINVFR